MKRRIRLFFLILLGAVAGRPTLYAQSRDIAMQEERILSFHSDLRIEPDARLVVTETIRVNALRQRIERGIYRVLPTERAMNGKTEFVKYNVVSVMKDGSPEPYHMERGMDLITIYIGDKDTYLNPGVYEYTIRYESDRQIGFFDDFDELYWNVSGNDWMFPIDRISATVHLPEGARLIQHACYTGAAGSVATNCSADTTDGRTLTWKAAGLSLHEGLTVAAGFSKGILRAPELPPALQTSNLVKILGGVIVLLLLAMAYLWHLFGRDHASPTVVPQFDVPEGLSPASLGYLSKGYYRNELLVASLINMAVKGVITITENKGKWPFRKQNFTISKNTAEKTNLSEEEKQLFSGLFKGSNSIVVGERYDSTIAQAVQRYMIGLRKKHFSFLQKGYNRWLVVVLFLFVSAVYWGGLSLVYHHIYNYAKYGIGIGLFVGAVIVTLICAGSRHTTARWIWLLPLLFTGAAVFYLRASGLLTDPFSLCYLFLLVCVTLLAIFSYLIRKPTEEQLRVLALIEGFSMYMGAAENQLIRFHNPPEMTPEVFEKYLPYALVLGVDAVWGKRFERLLKDNAFQYEQRWYSGSSTRSFSAGMVSSLSSSLSGAVSSSSTSSSSGSGGGGSSGGGGGGGGGGGW